MGEQNGSSGVPSSLYLKDEGNMYVNKLIMWSKMEYMAH